MTDAWRTLRSHSNEPFLVVEGIFSKDECNSVIESFSTQPAAEGVTWDGAAYSVNHDVRRLDTVYLPRRGQTDWIFARMDEIFFEAAKVWGLDVRETTEDLKFLIYREGSHFSTWHADIGDDYSCLRKLSMSVELCESTEYDGGNLQIFPYDEGHVAGPERSAGTCIVFPSHRHHRVTPVTRGTRFALVNWISGPPLR